MSTADRWPSPLSSMNGGNVITTSVLDYVFLFAYSLGIIHCYLAAHAQ